MKEQKQTTEKTMDKRTMEDLIISWGLPEYLESKKSSIIFKFDDDGLTDTSEKGYHCKDGSVKFCLYDEELGKVLFSMEFFRSGFGIKRLSPESKFGVTLQLLFVHDESLRKKGIASYYFNGLREYAIREKEKCIRVNANANAKNFRKNSKQNALSQKDLEKFYKDRSTPVMPVELI
ncbi:hypothetical protein [Lysinibacillus sp. LZ02]|uniref:hypothetical protein n=1 Tax=Lysinibacillus sp. LZ02 TaxID=3420668 RepID=UPI003D3650B2